jgi:glycosyltransferase involved in cell wall biosynthesis
VERAGHEVDYLCAEDAGAASQGHLARFRYPFVVWRRARAAEREGHPYDIINVHEPSAAAVSGFRRGFSAAIVVTSHGVEQRAWELALEEKRLGRGGPGWKTRLIHPLTSLWQSEVALSSADQVFCLNHEDRAYLTRRFDVPPERILRIYPGADEIYATAAATRDYSRANRLLFAGTWRKNKGIEDFVPAFIRLAAAWPELTLVVAGAGATVEAVRAHFPEAVRPRVETAHTASDLATAEVFAAADLFVLPSLFEGTPLTLMEGMMSGLPIVTTDTSGMKDVIEHERTGLLVPIRSPDAIFAAVDRLLRDPAQRARLGRAAQAEARELYTWDRAAEPVLAAYLHLAEQKR